MKQPATKTTRRSLLRTGLICLLALALPPALLLAGCGGGGGGGGSDPGGGGGGGGTGRLTLTVQWPAPDDSRLIPVASNGIRATLTRPGGTAFAERTLSRPAAPPWTTDVTFDNLAPGDLVLSASAYPNADATGTAQASGSAPAAIAAGQTTRVTVTMASTIARIAVSPANPTVPVGGQQAYTATAYDAADAVVLISPSTLSWQSGTPGIATVDAATGVATGVAVGAAQILATESESGKSGAAAITVTSGQQGDFDPHPTAVAVESGGQYLFLVEQGDAHLGGTYRGAVQRYRVEASGGLVRLSPPVTANLDRPHLIVAHPSQPFVYVADLAGVRPYRVNGDGTLTALSPEVAPVSRGYVVSLAISPDGVWVATHSKAAAIADSPVDLFRVNGDGTLTRTTTAGGNTNVSGADIAGNVALTAGRADGRFVVASRLASFGGGVDASGLFTMAVPDSGVPTSPRAYVQERLYGMTIDRSSTYLFATLDTPGEGRAIGDALVVTYRITTTGNHERLEVENPVGRNDSTFPRSLVCEPSGNFLYVQNFTEDSLSQLRINGDGTLTPLSNPEVPAPNPAIMAAHPQGGYLFVPNYEGRDDTAVTAFRIEEDGSLTRLGGS